MLRFGIDIDGTVTPYDCFYKLISDHFNITIDPKSITTYDILQSIDIPREEFMKWYRSNENELCGLSTIREHAQKILQKWHEDYKLYYISARSNTVFTTTESWFKKNAIPYHHIELLNSHDKIEAAKKFKIDLFFEDKHDNAVEISESCQIPVILFNTPYNQDPVPDSVIRVNNWLEVEKWVNRWLLSLKN